MTRLQTFVAGSIEALELGAPTDIRRIPGSRSEVYAIYVESETSPRFVVKESSLREIAALRAFEREGIEGVPSITAVESSSAPPLLLTPCYEGVHGSFGDMPAGVIDSLARIHACFDGGAAGLEGISPLSLEEMFVWTFGDMSIYAPDLRPNMEAIRGAVDELAELAADFPRTLVHWDMHPDNFLIGGQATVIVDWEHACIGPPLVDLTNMIAWDSERMRAYASAYERYSQRAFDWDAKQREFEWCRHVIELRYMFVAARAGDQEAPRRTADRVLAYLGRA